MHARPHEVAREAALDEDDVAAGRAGDARAAERERVDPQCQLVADGRARRWWARRRRRLGLRRGDRRSLGFAHWSSHSSSAFCAWRRFSAWSQIRWRLP